MSAVTACLLALLMAGCLLVEHHAEPTLDGMLEEAGRAETESVSDKIRALNAEIEECINKNDVDCIVDLLDEDCRIMRIDAETDIGKNAAKKHFQWVEMSHAPFTMTVDEIIPTDGFYVVERFQGRAELADGTAEFNGKGVMVWKKQTSGDYKIYIDILNANS